MWPSVNVISMGDNYDGSRATSVSGLGCPGHEAVVLYSADIFQIFCCSNIRHVWPSSRFSPQSTSPSLATGARAASDNNNKQSIQQTLPRGPCCHHISTYDGLHNGWWWWSKQSRRMTQSMCIVHTAHRAECSFVARRAELQQWELQWLPAMNHLHSLLPLLIDNLTSTREKINF